MRISSRRYQGVKTLFTVISKFTVAESGEMAAAVRQAFRDRPHIVEDTPGFVRLDVLNPRNNPAEIWLITFWTDEASFDGWYRTHKYHDAHSGIPDGLKLIPQKTEVLYFDHIAN